MVVAPEAEKQITALFDQLFAKQYIGSEQVKAAVKQQIMQQAAECVQQSSKGQPFDIMHLSVPKPSAHFTKLDLTLQFFHDPQQVKPLRMELTRDGKKLQLLFQPGKELPPVESLLPQKKLKPANSRGLPGHLYGKKRIQGRNRSR